MPLATNADERRLLKIGTTVRDPYTRIGEWAAQLSLDADNNNNTDGIDEATGGDGGGGGGGDEDEFGERNELLLVPPHATTVLLFSYATRWSDFAERVIHTALKREHASDRVAVRTQRDLIEFFYVGGDLLASTQFFVKSVTLFIDSQFSSQRHGDANAAAADDDDNDR